MPEASSTRKLMVITYALIRNLSLIGNFHEMPPLPEGGGTAIKFGVCAEYCAKHCCKAFVFFTKNGTCATYSEIFQTFPAEDTYAYFVKPRGCEKVIDSLERYVLCKIVFIQN